MPRGRRGSPLHPSSSSSPSSFSSSSSSSHAKGVGWGGGNTTSVRFAFIINISVIITMVNQHQCYCHHRRRHHELLNHRICTECLSCFLLHNSCQSNMEMVFIGGGLFIGMPFVDLSVWFVTYLQWLTLIKPNSKQFMCVCVGLGYQLFQMHSHRQYCYPPLACWSPPPLMLKTWFVMIMQNWARGLISSNILIPPTTMVHATLRQVLQSSAKNNLQHHWTPELWACEFERTVLLKEILLYCSMYSTVWGGRLVWVVNLLLMVVSSYNPPPG